MRTKSGNLLASLDVLEDNCDEDEEMARAVRERLEPAAAKGRAGTAPGSKVPTPKFGELEPLQTIGTGSFSRVRLVRNNNNGKYCALKSLKKAHLMKLKQVEHVISEKKILGEVHHPFIANLISTYQDAQCVYMLLEYVPGGELFYHLKKAGRFGVSTVRFYVAGIAVVLEHLHAQNIVYRDLKPENIMIDTNGYLKVTDFGFAKKVYDRTWTLCGTPEYLAPEVIQSRGHGRGVDWWGLGVMMFELLAGYPPFHHENPFVIYQRILEGRVDFPKHFDPWAKDLIRRLLTADQSKRIGNLYRGAADILEHRFFKDFDWEAFREGKMKPPFIPKIKSPGDTSNFEAYAESVDDPNGEQVDPAEAEQAFREF